MVAASTEHPSVLEWSQETVPVSDVGLLELDVLEERLSTGGALVSVMAANNETGVRQPVKRLVDCAASMAPRSIAMRLRCLGG